jgi:hypothetical protein
VISFSKLGSMGRLGNQMFQYSFLRLQAQHLGVKFYCPTWLGDSMFELEDDSERHLSPVPQPKEYHVPLFHPGSTHKRCSSRTTRIFPATFEAGGTWTMTKQKIGSSFVPPWQVKQEASLRATNEAQLRQFISGLATI